MSRRSVLGALCAGNGALESSTRKIAIAGQQQQQQQQRTFTSTATRHAARITHFTPTSSPALDELLTTIRQKIILPFYLPRAQRKKIYSPKYAKALQSDPVVIEIDGEVLKFRHLNPLAGDIPQARRSVIDAVRQFETPQDFANLRPLLEGIYYADYKFDPSFHAKILRVCGVKGRVYHAIECARAARTTGLRLDSSEKANEVLHFVQLKAADAGFDPKETAQALRWAEMVVDMLVDEQHLPHRRKDEHPAEGELPLDRDPQVLLARLHLAAALAKNPPLPPPPPPAEVEEEGDGAAAAAAAAAAAIPSKEELVEKVRDYATDIVKLWPGGLRLREVQPEELYQDVNKMGYLLDPSKFVALATPLLYGLDTAIEVVESPLAKQLRARRNLLHAEIQEVRAAIIPKEEPRRGESLYKRFYGEAAA